MQSKIVEFARLPLTVHEFVIEHFDDVEIRNMFLEILAKNKIVKMLEILEVPPEESMNFVTTLGCVDAFMPIYDQERKVDIEALSELMQEFKLNNLI